MREGGRRGRCTGIAMIIGWVCGREDQLKVVDDDDEDEDDDDERCGLENWMVMRWTGRG